MINKCKFGEIPPKGLIDIVGTRSVTLKNKVIVPTILSSPELVLMIISCKFGEIPQIGSKDILSTVNILTYLSPPMILKMRSRSSEFDQLLSLSQ